MARLTTKSNSTAVSEAMKTTPRTSSLVENLNSRLRNYFFLRKQLGSGYLDLLRFFLNLLNDTSFGIFRAFDTGGETLLNLPTEP
jgi:hypothetical protein